MSYFLSERACDCIKVLRNYFLIYFLYNPVLLLLAMHRQTVAVKNQAIQLDNLQYQCM